MFWLLDFLFGNESHKLKELEQRKKDRQVEQDRETLDFMVEELQSQLAFMEKNNLESLTFTLLNPSKFNYSLLTQTLSKIGSKIAYTRLESKDDIFSLTLYKSRPGSISRLYLAIVLRIVLWVVVASVMVYPLYLVAHPSIELLTSHYSSPFILSILLNFLVGFFGISSSNVLSGVIFKQFKVAKEFQHTIRFDEVTIDD